MFLQIFNDFTIHRNMASLLNCSAQYQLDSQRPLGLVILQGQAKGRRSLGSGMIATGEAESLQ